MESQVVVDIIRQALMTAFWLSLPLLAIGFVAGIVISLLQIVTSVQDPAFGSVPRLVAFLAGIVLFLPWMLMRLCTYTTGLFGDLSRYAR
ncbi:flagellar biosynthetic protein FliQ [uncultured Paludibaculum sp.]|uniref:flagellar biosynthetic protein FliQ n=1 Tax=uncultured Paludibaculum sp. TaxID=1765020 RepID=UPI002AAB2127|nr:flagellar biosynthetic protein FliQ [uncultured Paludibaculum sp.]